jgi:hypothetical protein
VFVVQVARDDAVCYLEIPVQATPGVATQYLSVRRHCHPMISNLA